MPPVVDVAVTVTVTVSPAAKLIPEKSWAKSGNHSYQAVRKRVQSTNNKKGLKRRMRTVVAHARVGDSEVDTGLQDGCLASVAIDTDPGRCGVCARAARRLARSGHDEAAHDGRVGSLRDARTQSGSSGQHGHAKLRSLPCLRPTQRRPNWDCRPHARCS